MANRRVVEMSEAKSREWIHGLVAFGIPALAFLAGCPSRTERVTPATNPAPSHPATPASAVQSPIPKSLVLSKSGREALTTIMSASFFGGSAIGVAGTPSAPIQALRTLWREKHPSPAFEFALQRGSPSGRLLALCGLYYSDPASFRRHLDRLRKDQTPVEVRANGCKPVLTPHPTAELVETKKAGAVRLIGPNDNIAAWSKRNPGVKPVFDIAGGGYPAMFRGIVEAPSGGANPAASMNETQPPAAYRCEKKEDCIKTCAHGAINRIWYEANRTRLTSCKDGCTRKGSQEPQCVDGVCVAMWSGKRDDGCTLKEIRWRGAD